jgi:hypothetical protein
MRRMRAYTDRRVGVQLQAPAEAESYYRRSIALDRTSSVVVVALSLLLTQRTRFAHSDEWRHAQQARRVPRISEEDRCLFLRLFICGCLRVGLSCVAARSVCAACLTLTMQDAIETFELALTLAPTDPTVQ